MARAHIDEEAPLSQRASSIAGSRRRLLRHGVIGAPAEAMGHRLTDLRGKAG